MEHLPWIHELARRTRCPLQDRDDLVHDVVVAACAWLQTHAEPRDLRAWLRCAAFNRARDRARKRAATRSIEANADQNAADHRASDVWTPGYRLELAETSRVVAAAIRSLAPRELSVLQLRLGGATLEVIAARLGSSRASVARVEAAFHRRLDGELNSEATTFVRRVADGERAPRADKPDIP